MKSKSIRLIKNRSAEDDLREVKYKLKQLAWKKWINDGAVKGAVEFSQLKDFLPEEPFRSYLDVFDDEGEIDYAKIDRTVYDFSFLEKRIGFFTFADLDKFLTRGITLYGEDATLQYYMACPKCETIVIEELDSPECAKPFICPTCWKEELRVMAEKDNKKSSYWWKYYAPDHPDYENLLKMIDSMVDFDKKWHFTIKLPGLRIYPFRLGSALRRLKYKLSCFVFPKKAEERRKKLWEKMGWEK